MRLIDKDITVKAVNDGCISTSKDIEDMDEVEAIPIDWLHKELIEAMYERKLSSEVLSVFHEIIAKWRKENESNISN